MSKIERQSKERVIAKIVFKKAFLLKDIYSCQHSESKDYSIIASGRHHVINENSAVFSHTVISSP